MRLLFTGYTKTNVKPLNQIGLLFTHIRTVISARFLQRNEATPRRSLKWRVTSYRIGVHAHYTGWLHAIWYSVSLKNFQEGSRQNCMLLVTMSYKKLITSDTNNALTFKRKLLNMTVITNKYYFLLEELG